jgi:hypothetical protein
MLYGKGRGGEGGKGNFTIKIYKIEYSCHVRR